MARDCLIYLISPPSFELEKFKQDLNAALSAVPGAVGAFQLRMKGEPTSNNDIIKAASELMPICHEYGVQFIINDDANIAKQVNADGVHLGENDGDVSQARDLLGKDKVIGVSCYDDADRAVDLALEGTDYVAFGAFYTTNTKTPKANPSPDILTFWTRNSVVPCVAIGGVNDKNCAELVKAGADFIAVVSYVWGHEAGPAEAIKSLQDKILNALKT